MPDSHDPLPPDILDAILRFDTCTIANAIEGFGVRLRNEGYARPGLQCVTGDSPRLIGYAATCRVRSSDPPVTGGAYPERTDWWKAIDKLPVPRIAVIQDLEPPELGGGSAVGEVHAAILKAFHCGGVITDGSVRDLPAVKKMRFPMFARAVSLSHAYSHMVDYGQPVEIFGLCIHPGDLLYADCHGVISIPREIAAKIPEAAAMVRVREQRIVAVCQSPGFSPKKLWKAIQDNS